MVGLYVSMNDCPPCKEFTPLLKEIYDEVNQDEKQLEIVFLSGDKSQEQWNEYFNEMPWIADKYGGTTLPKVA